MTSGGEPRALVEARRLRDRLSRAAHSTAGPYVLGAFGGVLYCFAYVGLSMWALVPVFLVPFWVGIDAARQRGRLAVFFVGLSFGAAAYASGHLWLFRLVEVFLAGHIGVGSALWIAYGLWFGVGFGLLAVLHAMLRERHVSHVQAGAIVWVLFEWAWPLLFPVHAGASLVALPALAQVLELGGPLLATTVVVCLNGVALSFARARPAEALLPGLLVVAALVFGLARMAVFSDEARLEGRGWVRVGLVQANLDPEEKWTRAVAGHRRHLELSRSLLAEGELDLLVWPETAYTIGLRRPLPIAGATVRREIAVPLLFGGTSVWQDEGTKQRANSSFVIGRDGTIRQVYDKNILIPLAEYAPLAAWLPGLADLMPHVQSFRAGTNTPALEVGDLRIATPICYEVIHPSFVRRMLRRSNAEIIVTLANDAWFGDSRAPRMHLALARMRAIELRRWMVRSTNSGISALIDPAGRVVARTSLLEAVVLRGRVGRLESTTIYAWLGDWPGWIAAVSFVAMAALRRPAPLVAEIPDHSSAPGSNARLAQGT